MTDTKKTMAVNPVLAGIAGAVAGGVAVAAAMSLNTKENKQKVTTAVDTTKAKIADVAGDVKKKIEATI